MKSEKIREESISQMKISSLPTRPTAPSSLGGRGYSSAQMRAAFDKLPLYIIERFNLLIDDILAEGKESISGAIKTGFREDHSLYNMFCDIREGGFAEYMSVGETSLMIKLCEIEDRLSRLEERFNEQN